MYAARVLTSVTIKTLDHTITRGFKTLGSPGRSVKWTHAERKQCGNPRCCSGISIPSVFQFLKIISYLISKRFFRDFIYPMTRHTCSFILPQFYLECASTLNTDFQN